MSGEVEVEVGVGGGVSAEVELPFPPQLESTAHALKASRLTKDRD
jgi:hypothetical protein